MRKTLIFTLWAILFLAVAGVSLVFTAIAKGKIGYVPPVEELENPNLKFATQIISDDGVTLGTYSYSTDNRIYVGYEDLSPHLVNALIATEDERFAEHSGIDARALVRAIVNDILKGEAQCASAYLLCYRQQNHDQRKFIGDHRDHFAGCADFRIGRTGCGAAYDEGYTGDGEQIQDNDQVSLAGKCAEAENRDEHHHDYEADQAHDGGKDVGEAVGFGGDDGFLAGELDEIIYRLQDGRAHALLHACQQLAVKAGKQQAHDG